MAPIITLLTDFGTRDAYVASMKGAILSVAPAAQIVDVTHEVRPQDVVEGAWLLASAFRYFPPGTVHVAVVDPGVGGERRAIAAAAGGWLFVGPDNGVLSWALDAAGDVRAVELRDARWFRGEVSRTFHGRDIFAPVAAHLAAGVPLDELGPRIDDVARLPLPQPAIEAERIACEVVHVDRFGNAITNLDRRTFDTWASGRPHVVTAGRREIGPVRATYADAARGEPLALFESTGHLEVAVREGSADHVLGLRRGAAVIVEAR